MIAALRGTVLEVALDHTVIECGGVGYQVHATPSTLATLRRGAEARLLTSMIVRDDGFTLYGFTDAEAKDLFALLQTVTGVGPRLALAVLAVHGPDELSRAIATDDQKALARVPGVGKKVAERLARELREKVVAPTTVLAQPGSGTLAGTSAVAGQVREALVGLGFSDVAAESAVRGVLAETPELDAAALLRGSLAALGRNG